MTPVKIFIFYFFQNFLIKINFCEFLAIERTQVYCIICFIKQYK